MTDKQEFEKLFFTKKWKATKNKNVTEVACDGLYSWHQTKMLEMLERVEKEVLVTTYKINGVEATYTLNIDEQRQALAKLQVEIKEKK